MGKEIERKWLLNPSFYPAITDIVKQGKKVCITDLYFNPFARLRKQDNTFMLTIKSDGFLCRDEYEYNLNIIDFPEIDKLLLHKTRYFVKDINIFEVNIYDNLFYSYDHKLFKFVLIEREQENMHEDILLPQWIGQEVTLDRSYYNYELFQRIQTNSIIN